MLISPLILISYIALDSLSGGIDADALGVAAVSFGTIFFILRVARARIVLADVNILVINPVFTYEVPYGAVRSVREENTLILVTKVDGAVYSAAFGSSVIDHFVRSTGRAVDAVDRRVRAFRGGGEGRVVKRMTRAWVTDLFGLGALICGVAAVWAGSL
ncbi:hypothetical protein RM717_30640 [Streptomyces griseus]|uniref:Integral membrane protein n=1 Tax=Streptomyces stephensoniae TaxID=3375367 RepID=A0ABU2WAE2_9ACTN|nr:hypothetical protein [Streptomyces griseus]MDT0494858.1 hypothetical protein [Streptomyces griseus]